jgi:phosphatidylinositol alpha-mannosyltransferase
MSKQLKTARSAAKALKVGFVFDDSLDSNDGVAQYVKRLGGWLSGQGHEVRYLVGESKTTSWQGGKVYSLSRNLKISFNGNKLSMPVRSSKNQIKAVLAAEDFDVLHVQVPYSPVMAQRVINAAPAKTAIIGTFHILPADAKARLGTRLLKPVYGRSLKRFDTLAGVTLAAANFASGTLKVPTVVSPNTIDLSQFAVKPQRKATPEIIFLGRLVKRKGCLELLKAFNILVQDTPAHLTIAGKGPDLSKLKSYVQKNELQDKVKFLGFVSEQDKPKILASADVACFPAMYGESFGIVLIEAMAAGAGVTIGGNNPGYASVLGRSPEALFDPKNSRQFADTLRRLIQDKLLAKQLHQAQMEEVKQYDVNVVGAQVLNLYHQAIAKANQRMHN